MTTPTPGRDELRERLVDKVAQWLYHTIGEADQMDRQRKRPTPRERRDWERVKAGVLLSMISGERPPAAASEPPPVEEAGSVRVRLRYAGQARPAPDPELDKPPPAAGEDGTDRLCRALYGRAAEPRDYLGGASAKMLHDAADRLTAAGDGDRLTVDPDGMLRGKLPCGHDASVVEIEAHEGHGNRAYCRRCALARYHERHAAPPPAAPAQGGE